MKKEDKKVMDQYATGEIKAVEPSEELPKYKFKKWEEYYTQAVDLIEKKYSHRNRQWCHDQLNRALDNTEFHHLADVVSEDKYDDAKCQMIDEILAGEFGIYTQLQEEIRFLIFGDNNDCCDRSLMSRFYDKIDLPSGDLSPDQSLEFDKIADDLSRWYARHLTQNGGKIKGSK